MLLLTLAAQFLEEPARASRLLPGVKMKAKKSFVTCETACKYDNTLQVQMASCREREREMLEVTGLFRLLLYDHSPIVTLDTNNVCLNGKDLLRSLLTVHKLNNVFFFSQCVSQEECLSFP